MMMMMMRVEASDGGYKEVHQRQIMGWFFSQLGYITFDWIVCLLAYLLQTLTQRACCLVP